MDEFVATLDTWLQAHMETVHTMLPGVVQSYDSATRTATVKPTVKLRSLHGDLLSVPPIPSVPVVWPSTAAFSLFGRLQQGDGVMLVVSEASIGNWQRGTEEAEAEDETRFSLQDMVAVPGLWAEKRVPKHTLRTADWGMASESVVLGAKDSKVVLENAVTNLREEVVRIYDRIAAINLYMAQQAAVLAAVSVGPLAVFQPGFQGIITQATLETTTNIPADKLKAERILA